MSTHTISEIALSELFHLESPQDYKVHLATAGGNYKHPLNHFYDGQEYFTHWQSQQSQRNFSRKFIIALIELKKSQYLFAGIYKVNGCEEPSDVQNRGGQNATTKYIYDCELTEQYEKYIGKLVVSVNRDRASYLNLENFFDKLTVHSLLPERISTQQFPGYNKINHSFEDIARIVRKSATGWKTALENMNGVYVLIDDSSNKKYVGSATGDGGIWSRWRGYVENYTGGNKELDTLHTQCGEEHFKEHFKFVLIEHFTQNTDDSYVFERETFWKNALNSKNKLYGYNCN